MIDPTAMVTALVMGISSSVHCLGMCGGLALAISSPQKQWLPLVYHAGRLAIYSLLGAVGALLLWGVSQWFAVGLRFFSGVLLIAAGLYIGRWWFGLVYIEKKLAFTWQIANKYTQAILPPKKISDAFLLGLLWGMMPCGLIYSSVLWASAYGGALDGALLMLLFGIGTLPALLGLSFAGQSFQRVFQHAIAKKLLGGILISIGLWVALGAVVLGERLYQHDYLCSPSALITS